MSLQLQFLLLLKNFNNNLIIVNNSAIIKKSLIKIIKITFRVKLFMSSKSDILQAMIPIVKALGHTFAPDVEVVLHKVTEEGTSIIAIENGHVTGRQYGGPITNYFYKMKEDNIDMKLNYLNSTKDGKPLKSSSIFIYDEKKQVIGVLCINIDLTSVQLVQKFLGNLFRVEEIANEEFPKDAIGFLEIMIQDTLDKIEKPVNLLSKNDNLKIVRYLHNNNIFRIKGAVNFLANKLKVSRYTIYNYIDEIKENSGN